MTKRSINKLIKGRCVSDGAGVRLTRSMGIQALPDLDPFLLFDVFYSDNPDDYINGFPSHPHRGFETATYLLAGRMRHKDSVGNEGIIAAGGVQWMTAGSGIIHSEIPAQENGLLHGLQLWINLPASHKMTAPAYQEYEQAEIPIITIDGAQIHVIAGKTTHYGKTIQGPVSNPYVNALYFDIELTSNASYKEPLPDTYNAFIYVLEGTIRIISCKGTEYVSQGHLVVLSKGDRLHIENSHAYSRCIVAAGQPIHEPVVRSGPFVMNNTTEIQQAILDYQNKQFIR